MSLFVKALRPGAVTNMSVDSGVRQYSFTLTAADLGTSPAAYTIDFEYPRPAVAVTSPVAATRQVGSYKLGGKKTLWPIRIRDDGEHVFMTWPVQQDMPAVYAIDGQGRESLTNGSMRGAEMVIDDISPRLIFRLGDIRATATRFVSKAKRRSCTGCSRRFAGRCRIGSWCRAEIWETAVRLARRFTNCTN